MKKQAIALAMATLMAASMTACSVGSKTETTAAETTAEKKEETTTAGTPAAETAEAAGGTLIVVFDQDFPPMGFVGDNGEYTGFELDLAKEVASRLGLEYKAQPIAWDSKDMELNKKYHFDIVFNPFTCLIYFDVSKDGSNIFHMEKPFITKYPETNVPLYGINELGNLLKAKQGGRGALQITDMTFCALEEMIVA